MQTDSPHRFHIPVMGLAYTVDSPIKVACYGINSAISIIEDNLIEMMRKYYYKQVDQSYIPITRFEPDYRARRITDYLNLVNQIVHQKVEKLKNSLFESGSELVKYFEMLPTDHSLQELYQRMVRMTSPEERQEAQATLRKQITPGTIEVNIMTKLDKNNTDQNGALIEDSSDAVAALRGYANSNLKNSSIIFSAGMNPRLFNYLETLNVFDAKGWGEFDKQVVIKVSDFRSALIQGKYLAKKGIWVSEFRIESGLNCGGHAFATDGLLLGPILEEFKTKRDELVSSLSAIYNAALQAKGKSCFDKPHPVRITVQGGIGTPEENDFLHTYYSVDSTGWGTPFLLCPEATTVDDETLVLLSKAKTKDVFLSKNSPLGVRFNYLKGTSAEKEKTDRINKGVPGSPCTEKYLVANTEFTEDPICTASMKYQKLKLEQLKAADLSEREYNKQVNEVLSKECLCIGLSNSAAIQYKQPFVKGLRSVNICPGPNIAYFSKIISLKEITDFIYGRSHDLTDSERPHMFVKELQLYVDYIKEQMNEEWSPTARSLKYHTTFCNNLLEGINYYRELVSSNEMGVSSEELDRAFNGAELEVKQVLDQISRMTLNLSAATEK